MFILHHCQVELIEKITANCWMPCLLYAWATCVKYTIRKISDVILPWSRDPINVNISFFVYSLFNLYFFLLSYSNIAYAQHYSFYWLFQVNLVRYTSKYKLLQFLFFICQCFVAACIFQYRLFVTPHYYTGSLSTTLK